MLFFFIYKTLKQINETPTECSREYCECVLPGTGHFSRHYERINFTTKQLKPVKKPTFEQKWLYNKQILIRCYVKLDLSVQKYWKDKIQGLQNIKCIPLGHTSRFHPLLMVVEICCETRFRRSQNTICFCKRWTFFSFYIIIKTILLRKCFEYAHTITRDWICFESGLDCQSPK